MIYVDIYILCRNSVDENTSKAHTHSKTIQWRIQRDAHDAVRAHWNIDYSFLDVHPQTRSLRMA